MTTQELGLILKKMYEKAPKGEITSMILLFGIKYSEIIKNNKISCKDITLAACIQNAYKTEIRKGVKLAKYVQIKSE